MKQPLRRSDQDKERAREELGRAHSAYDVAHVTYTRLADVQKTRPELVAQQDIDVAQGKDLEASAGVSAAKDALAAAEQASIASKASLDKDKAMFAYARMTAPFDGVVTQINAYTGALLPAGTGSGRGESALCRLSQNDVLRLVIPVPERAVPDIHIGQDVTVDVSALKRTFTGKMVRFSGQIDPATRTMHTEVTVPNANYQLVPGMYASVRLPLHSAQHVLALPVQAVQSAGEGQGWVLVVDASNRLEKLEVAVGLQTASRSRDYLWPRRKPLGRLRRVGPIQSRPARQAQIVAPSDLDSKIGIRSTMPSFSLRHPYFIIVICLFLCVLGLTSVVQMPVDMFPPINIPVVLVATFYGGMPPEQIEADITDTFERFFTLGSGIDHMESRSMSGVSLIKIYFQPGTDANADVTQISNLAMADLRRLPQGTLPPVVMKVDASSLPVCLLTVSGPGLD